MQSGEEFVRTWFDRVWNEDDDEAIYDMFAGGKVEGLGAQTNLAPDDFKNFKEAMCGLINNIHVNVDKCLEGDVWISALCTLKAKAVATGERITITGNVWIRREAGKIVEAYNHFDFMGLWSQLGLLPEDALEQGLTGQKVV